MPGFVPIRNVTGHGPTSLVFTGLGGDTVNVVITGAPAYHTTNIGSSSLGVTFTLNRGASSPHYHYTCGAFLRMTPPAGVMIPSGSDDLFDTGTVVLTPHPGSDPAAAFESLLIYVRRDYEASSNQCEATWYPTGHPSDPSPPGPSGRSAPGIITTILTGAGLPTPAIGAGVPATDVYDPGSYDRADLAADAADRAGVAARDWGLGVWTVEPWPTATGTPVLEIATGDNLISLESGLDCDTSGFAQQVRLTYDWTDGTGPHTVAATSSPSHGPQTLEVARRGIPVTAPQAQQAANALGARAWLRGRSLTVECPLAAWVRPWHTIRLTPPTGGATDYLVATARHDYTAKLSRFTLRPATLTTYPPGE